MYSTAVLQKILPTLIYGGQLIGIVPDLDLIVAITMDTDPRPAGPALPPILWCLRS
jgi:hypothetical protein